MLIHDADRLNGHLVRAHRLGWPIPRSLRHATEALLARRGFAVCDPQAPAAVLSLALLVSSLPSSDLDAAVRLLDSGDA
jgi:hypothetical protein